MASTRNNNTPGNYCLEQRNNRLIQDYDLYKNSQNGNAYDPAIPPFGITPSHMPSSEFSHNPVEIESALFGINSTNLVTPQPPVNPQLKQVPEKSFIEKIPLIMPDPLTVEKDQRPFPI